MACAHTEPSARRGVSQLARAARDHWRERRASGGVAGVLVDMHLERRPLVHVDGHFTEEPPSLDPLQIARPGLVHLPSIVVADDNQDRQLRIAREVRFPRDQAAVAEDHRRCLWRVQVHQAVYADTTNLRARRKRWGRGGRGGAVRERGAGRVLGVWGGAVERWSGGAVGRWSGGAVER